MKNEILTACLILGLLVRYMVALSQGCLFIGKAISDGQSKTGFQDAITPPLATGVAALLYALSVALIVFAFWHEGLRDGSLAAFSLVFWIFVGGFIVPKPNSGHWVRMVFRSIVKRTADYAKAGDVMRAEPAGMLAKRIGELFGSALRS